MEALLIEFGKLLAQDSAQALFYAICFVLAWKVLPIFLEPITKSLAARIDIVGRRLEETERHLQKCAEESTWLREALNTVRQKALADAKACKASTDNLEALIFELRNEVLDLKTKLLAQSSSVIQRPVRLVR